jgi:hypothetical protein
MPKVVVEIHEGMDELKNNPRERVTAVATIAKAIAATTGHGPDDAITMLLVAAALVSIEATNLTGEPLLKMFATTLGGAVRAAEAYSGKEEAPAPTSALH